MPFNKATSKAPIIPPERSRKKWNSKMFTEIGAVIPVQKAPIF